MYDETGHTGGVTAPRAPHRRHNSVLITDLATSRTAEIRERERRYVIAMVFRAVCFLAAALLFHGAARWIAVAIAIAMPWIAVVLANQPKIRKSRHAEYVPPAPREAMRLEQGRDHRVIDPD